MCLGSPVTDNQIKTQVNSEGNTCQIWGWLPSLILSTILFLLQLFVSWIQKLSSLFYFIQSVVYRWYSCVQYVLSGRVLLLFQTILST